MIINAMALRQVRNGIKRDVNESPEIIVIYRAETFVDNGFGVMVKNPLATTVAQDLVKCRLSHQARTIDMNDPGPAGFRTALERYILTDYQTQIFEGDVFEAQGRKFRIGVVDILKKFGGVVGYQALLIDANGE